MKIEIIKPKSSFIYDGKCHLVNYHNNMLFVFPTRNAIEIVLHNPYVCITNDVHCLCNVKPLEIGSARLSKRRPSCVALLCRYIVRSHVRTHIHMRISTASEIHVFCHVVISEMVALHLKF